MTELKKKVKLALDETRLLVLGGQILLGFQYRSVLQPGFDLLPHATQLLKMFALLGMLVTMLLLMWPAAYHQIAEHGEVTGALHRFVTWVATLALLPFASVLASEVYAVAQLSIGRPGALLVAIIVNSVALFYWFGLEWTAVWNGVGAKERAMSSLQQRERPKPTELVDKIDDVLTECRVVIPGAQALLGFQLIAMLTEGFQSLPKSSQYVHLGALLLIAFSMILLMTPAAYHRIVEAGESSVEFWLHARRMLLSGMAILAIGLVAEFYVVTLKIVASTTFALTLSMCVLGAIYGAWFVYPFLIRTVRKSR